MGARIASLFAAAVFLLPSCLQPRYSIDTANVRDAAEHVIVRVEHYAAHDTKITAEDSAEIKADVVNVREQLAQPLADQRVLAAPLVRICDRHDEFVAGDIAILPIERSVYLESTARLRRLVKN